MSWYEKDTKEKPLDYSKPIVANFDGDLLLLTPVHELRRHKVIGWDWLYIQSGLYESCYTWKDPREAVKCYEEYNPRNIDLNELIKGAVK